MEQVRCIREMGELAESAVAHTSNPYFAGDTDSDKECHMSKELVIQSHLRNLTNAVTL